MSVFKTVRLSLLGCSLLLLVGCGSLTLNRVIVNPEYSFSQDKLWLIVPFEVNPIILYGFDDNQRVDDPGLLLAGEVKKRLDDLGIKASIPQAKDQIAVGYDYIIRGKIITVDLKNRIKDTPWDGFASKGRWGRSRVRANSSSNMSIKGQIIRISTNKVMADFDLYETTFAKGSPGLNALLKQLSEAIAGVVLGNK